MNLISQENSVFLIVDVQEKLVNMLTDNSVYESAIKLAKTAQILDMPVIISEQYPKGLGQTIQEIKDVCVSADYLEKTSFSICNQEGFLSLLKSKNKKQVILFGIETHICVLQTVFDLVNNGYEVFIVKDACGSRNQENKELALSRMQQNGIQILSLEMVLFELLKSSNHEKFKDVQSLIK